MFTKRFKKQNGLLKQDCAYNCFIIIKAVILKWDRFQHDIVLLMVRNCQLTLNCYV